MYFILKKTHLFNHTIVLSNSAIPLFNGLKRTEIQNLWNFFFLRSIFRIKQVISLSDVIRVNSSVKYVTRFLNSFIKYIIWKSYDCYIKEHKSKIAWRAFAEAFETQITYK